MKVYTLGTGAPLAYHRASMGILVESETAQPLLVDTCSGNEVIRRIAALGKSVEDHHHVVLTHRHADHIGGVLPLSLAVQPIEFYGSEDVLRVAKQLIELTYGDIASRVLDRASFHPVVPDQSYSIAGYDVSFFEVDHRVLTYAVRIAHGGKIFAFSADSLPCENLIRCAKEADLFLCDAICAARDDPAHVAELRALAHATADEAAEMAKAAGAKQLGLVHVARNGTPEKMLAEARSIFDGPVNVPDDNHCYSI